MKLVCPTKMVCKGMLFGWWLVLILELQIVSCKHYTLAWFVPLHTIFLFDGEIII